jgi:hypothetical protein
MKDKEEKGQGWHALGREVGSRPGFIFKNTLQNMKELFKRTLKIFQI